MTPAPPRKGFLPPRDPRRPRFARPAVEHLEGRCLLTRLYALTDLSSLLQFDSTAPGPVLSTKQLGQTNRFLGSTSFSDLDVRPATGQLYGLGLSGSGFHGAPPVVGISLINVVTGHSQGISGVPPGPLGQPSDFSA